MYSVVNVYDKLPDIIDKLIVALVFDIGYKQNIAALILNVSDVAITKRIHKIKRLLGQEVNKSHIGSS